MEQDIRGNISAALESRRRQREPIAALHDTWLALAGGVDALAAALDQVSSEFTALGKPTADQQDVARELQEEPGHAEIAKLAGEIAALTPDLDAVRRRIHRDTVNVGVVGRTKAGKSHLLRTITGLDKQTIPSSEFNPTTAARSRIFHVRGKAEADVDLLSWPEFRDGYLAELHTGADCLPAPRTSAEFADRAYASPADQAGEGEPSEGALIHQKFLKRLLVAQESFDSYRKLLAAPDRHLFIDRLADLRPYVAYPEDENNSHNRPYHAVRDVRIYCEFPLVDVDDLVLVDLPGAGEAGLNIDKQFLQDMKNEVDVLLHVKRPGHNEAFFTDADWDVLALADEASMGVDLEDFACIVINKDPEHVETGYLDNAVKEAGEIARNNKLQLFVCDVNSEQEVRDLLLSPVLSGLASKLAMMDRAAAELVLVRASAVAAKAVQVAERLGGQVGRWASHIPDEERALRERAKILRNQTAQALDNLRSEHDRRVADGERVPEVDDGITHAVDELTSWAAAGFGAGNQEKWLVEVEPAMVADPGETRDDAYSTARHRLRTVFGQIDSSLASAVTRVHQSIADVLRGKLTDRMVPAGGNPLGALLETARQRRLDTIGEAIEDLLQFGAGYGSVFLRVGRPIVRQIYPMPGNSAAAAHGTEAGNTSGTAGTAADTDVVRTLPADTPEPSSTATSRGSGKLRGSLVSLGSPPSEPSRPPTPAAGGSPGATAGDDGTAAGLYVAVTDAFTRAVKETEHRMREEARQLTEVLAAALDQFFDIVSHTPEVEQEFETLCQPIRRDLWPDLFDGTAAALRSGLDRITAEAVATADMGRDVTAKVRTLRWVTDEAGLRITS